MKKLEQLKRLAQQLIDNINWCDRNKDNFKGLDDDFNRNANLKMLEKIADTIQQLTITSFEGAGINDPKHIAELLAEFERIHETLVVTKTGDLKSCVQMCEEKYGLSPTATFYRSPDNVTII